MAADQQFIDALKYLGTSMQGYGISQALSKANEQAQQIRMTMTDDLQQRQALRNLAQYSTVNAAAGGADANQVNALNASIMPIMPSTAEQAMLQGAATGDNFLAQIGKDAIKAQEDRDMRKFKLQADLDTQRALATERLALNREDRQAQRDLAKDERLQGNLVKKENREVFTKMQGGLTKAQQQYNVLDSLEKELKATSVVGTGPVDQYASRFTDRGQLIQQKMNELALGKMSEMFSGMAGAINSDSERRFFQDAQISTSNYESVNLELIKNAKENAKALINKTQSAMQSYQESGGVTFNAFPSATTGKDQGFTPKPTTGPLMNFFTPTKR